MSRATKAASLYQLQQLDEEVERVAAEAQAISAALQDDTAMRQAAQELEAAQNALRQHQKSLRTAEQELADLTARIKGHNDRLYSGKVVNPRELGSLQQEVQHLRQAQSLQEDRVLEAMTAVDDAKALVVEKTARHEATTKAHQQEMVTLTERQRQTQERLAQLRQRRQSLAEACEAGLLQRYEQLRRTRGGKAVALAESGTCKGCRVTLTASDMQRLRTSAEIITCSNCGRMLYLP
jgi:predicted  nucleic acid-binding Zn-ribbon protein